MKSAKSELWRRMSAAGIFLLADCLWAQFAPRMPKVPKALRPPKGEALILHLHGKGKQVYVCLNASGGYAWKLKAPDADLFGESGELAGRHYAGPTWEANDGSRVDGKMVASVASDKADAIPWLLLEAASHSGTGIMTRVQSIQRLATKGGVAPDGGCDAARDKEETAVGYEASYYFYGTSLPKMYGR
jgi:hypothetical protein